VIESETYTVGFSQVDSGNWDVSSGGYNFYRGANIESSQRNVLYQYGKKLVDEKPLSAYFGTTICPQSGCSEYSQQEQNRCVALDIGEPNKDGFEFIASKSGRLHTLRLSLAASYIPGASNDVEANGRWQESEYAEVGEVWIAIYKGSGFGRLLRKQKFTAGAKTCCNTEQCVLHDYTFKNPIDVIESETYTVGFSQVVSGNEVIVSGGYDFYHHANIEISQRNVWYANGKELVDEKLFSAYFGTSICPRQKYIRINTGTCLSEGYSSIETKEECRDAVESLYPSNSAGKVHLDDRSRNPYPQECVYWSYYDSITLYHQGTGERDCSYTWEMECLCKIPDTSACSQKTSDASQKWDDLVNKLGSLRRRRSLETVNDVFEVFLDAMNNGELLNVKY